MPFERGVVVGARRTGLCQELQRYWVFLAQQFLMCIKNSPPPKGHPTDVTTVGKNWSQNGPVSLWNACHLGESMPQQM